MNNQYLMINEATNIVENVCVWDGDVNTWQPPENTLMLVLENTPSIVWQAIVVNKVITDWELVEVIGLGQVGFTWNGTVCTTNQPKPEILTTQEIV
jgi:hypothetical protein